MYKKLADGLWVNEKTGEIIQAKKKGRYSKAIVALCILLAVGYTAFCLFMQYRTGTQPEPQLTIAFFAFISAELWNLGKIKRHKSENRETRKDEFE